MSLREIPPPAPSNLRLWMITPRSSEFAELHELGRCLGLVDHTAGIRICADIQNCAKSGHCKLCEFAYNHRGVLALVHLVCFILFQIMANINSSCVRRIISRTNGHKIRVERKKSFYFRNLTAMDIIIFSRIISDSELSWIDLLILNGTPRCWSTISFSHPIFAVVLTEMLTGDVLRYLVE